MSRTESQSDKAKTLLNSAIALTFSLSLFANAVRAIFGDRVPWLANQSMVLLLAAPGVLFLIFVGARFALLPFLRRVRPREYEPPEPPRESGSAPPI